MVKYEKKNNLVAGLIMEITLFLLYSYYFFNTVSNLFRGFSNAFIYSYLAADLLILFVTLIALIIMIIRKRQSGFGVTLPMAAILFESITSFIAGMINDYSPDWGHLVLSSLLIFPIIIVIVYFFVPNAPLKIISAVAVGIAILVSILRFAVTFINISRYSFPTSNYIFIQSAFFIIRSLLYALIMIQIFNSFKKVRQPFAQPVYGQPTAPVAPVPPVTPRVVSNEEKLANFQNLLEKGLITREQFDEKKKEILSDE